MRDPHEVHRRLAAALTGDPCEPVPDAFHERLAVALGLTEAREVPPEDAHRRLAAALWGEAAIALPVGIRQRFAEAITGGPTLPQGIHERLARALQR
jgi:hypothetical protein